MWITWWSIMTWQLREFMFCKVRVWRGYFCNWLRKNWPVLTKTELLQNIESPLFVPPTTISDIISPINVSCLKSLPTPFIKGGRTIMITKIDYTNITKKSLIKQKKIVSFVKDEEEIVNFIKLKTTNIEIIDIKVGKTLNPEDLTSLEVESMKNVLFKDIQKGYPKLCLKIAVKYKIFIFSLLSVTITFLQKLFPIYFLSF